MAGKHIFYSRVQTPSQPHAIVKLDNDNSQGGQLQTVGPTGTHPNGTNIIFENVRFNQGNVYDNTTGRFTAPVPGTYQVNFSSNLNTSQVISDGYADVEIHLNGSLYLRYYENVYVGSGTDLGTPNWQFFSGSTDVFLNANDYVTICLRTSSGHIWADSDVNYTQASFRLLG
jgi:hypothetical protein